MTKQPDSGEPVHSVLRFLQLLEEMEEKGQRERTISGSVDGPFFSRAVYGGVVRLGLERDDPSQGRVEWV
jgi:hypothetical protein